MMVTVLFIFSEIDISLHQQGIYSEDCKSRDPNEFIE